VISDQPDIILAIYSQLLIFVGVPNGSRIAGIRYGNYNRLFVRCVMFEDITQRILFCELFPEIPADFIHHLSKYAAVGT